MTANGRVSLVLLAALLLGIPGWLLLVDRPGLRVEYFPLQPTWQGRSVTGGIGEPQIADRTAIADLVSKDIYSARWQGWLRVDNAGEYRFRIKADEEAYLVVDGQRQPEGRVKLTLERGFVPIEIGFNQTRRESWLSSRWTPPGKEAASIPTELLYARHPVLATHLLRRALAPLSVTLRQLLGVGLLLTSLLLLRAAWVSTNPNSNQASEAIPEPRQPDPQITLKLTLLASLFAACWWWTSRFAAPLMGGDDVLYLHQALFPVKGQWFYNRYVHVYLLKLFVWLGDGDGFLGSRVYFSFVSSVTVAALAVAVSSLGPRLQVRTLAATLFVLASQTTLFGRACGAFADFTCMMFVTVAVAVYLHGLSARSRATSVGWHPLVIGALTLAAFKSKETGIILAWLPLLFLWTDGRFDLRRFGRKIVLWAVGFAGAWLILALLDGWLLGDFWYSLKPDFAAMKRIHVTQSPQVGHSFRQWVLAAWSPGAPAAEQALRYLWIVALAAPVVAIVKRKGIEMTLLLIMPLAYFLLLIAVHARAPHIFSTRYFFTILPVACLAVGATLNFLGIETPLRGRITRPRVLVPLFMSILILVLFGPSFHRVIQTVNPRLLAQRGELLLYPWETFRDELESARPETIVVPPELWRVYHMVGQHKTREKIAQIFFRRRDLRMWQSRDLGPDVDYAIAAPDIFKTWRRQIPGLRNTAVYDPSGRFALVQPRRALSTVENELPDG